FQFVRENMPLREIVTRAAWRVPVYALELPLVEPLGSWRAYEDQLSKKQHDAFARKRRRLQALGAVSFGLLPYDTPGVVEWIVTHKKKWLAKVGWKDKIWLTSRMYAAFLQALLSELGPDGRCRVFAVRRGDRLIAADINFIDRHTMQWY